MWQDKVNHQDSAQTGCDMNLVSFSRSSSRRFLTVLCLYNKHFSLNNNRNPPPMVTAQGSPKHRPNTCIFCVHIQLWVWLSPTIPIHTQKKSPFYLLQLYETSFTPLHFAGLCRLSPVHFAFPLVEGLDVGAHFLLTFQDESSCTCKTSAMFLFSGIGRGEYIFSHGNHLLLIPTENS